MRHDGCEIWLRVTCGRAGKHSDPPGLRNEKRLGAPGILVFLCTKSIMDLQEAGFIHNRLAYCSLERKTGGHQYSGHQTALQSSRTKKIPATGNNFPVAGITALSTIFFLTTPLLRSLPA
jgi:hypothetical protein